MRILIISPTLPYPLIDGGRRGVYFPVKYLAARGHRIHFACLADEIRSDAVKEMERFATVSVTLNKRKPTFQGALKQLFKTTPYYLSRFHNDTFLQNILQLLSSGFDVVQVEGIHSAFYGLEIKKRYNIPVILRLHNIESMNIKTYMEKQSNYLIRCFLKNEQTKLCNYENKYCKIFDRVLLVSQQDEKLLLNMDHEIKTAVVPSGVEIEDYSNDGGSSQEEDGTVLWIGALGWPPNQDSFWWFYNKIVPLLIAQKPDIKIEVVGSNPPSEIRNLVRPNVKVIGEVIDVKQYYRRAQVCVVPLRAGSGIRMKLLEMFAMKKAVVSTSIGCEGLNVNHLQHLWIADNEKDFANGIVLLLQNEHLRKTIGNWARKFIEKSYSWDYIASQFEEKYKMVLPR
jgi:polysaccharide biosynthesis protein PslH